MDLSFRTSGLATIASTARCAIVIGLLAIGSSVAIADGGSAIGSPQASSGAIIGIVTDANNRPVARATVKAVSADGAGFRATLTAVDGSYSFSDLPRGKWSVTT